MTHDDFVRVIAYLTAGCGKELSDAAIEVYFDLLRDLPSDIFQNAAQRVLLEHRWATFPSIAELREAASATARGIVSELSSAEAWELAWKAAAKIDLEVPGRTEHACKSLPPIVVAAMKAFGIPALCYGKEPIGVVRAQFMKTYEQLASRDRRQSLLPERVTQEIVSRAPAITAFADRIGRVSEQACEVPALALGQSTFELDDVRARPTIPINAAVASAQAQREAWEERWLTVLRSGSAAESREIVVALSRRHPELCNPDMSPEDPRIRGAVLLELQRRTEAKQTEKPAETASA
jgi:hypothetical protein